MAQNTSSAVMQQRQEAREEWRGIQGWPGYEISNLGRVRSWKWPSVARQWIVDTCRSPRILKPCQRNGYLSIILSDTDVGRKWASIHVLVLEAFVGPRPDEMQAAHNDGDRLNNSASNLRWATPAANNADKARHGTAQSGDKIGTARLSWADVDQIRARRIGGDPVSALARKFGVCRNTITNITTGRSWIPPCRKRLERDDDYTTPTQGD